MADSLACKLRRFELRSTYSSVTSWLPLVSVVTLPRFRRSERVASAASLRTCSVRSATMRSWSLTFSTWVFEALTKPPPRVAICLAWARADSMSVTWTVSWAVRRTMRSRTWALVSGRLLLGAAAELAATAERWGAAAAASLATLGAGAPTATPPATAGAEAGGWAAFRFVDSGGDGGDEEGRALQATAPRTTRAAARSAKRGARYVKRMGMRF